MWSQTVCCYLYAEMHNLFLWVLKKLTIILKLVNTDSRIINLEDQKSLHISADDLAKKRGRRF